MKRRWRSAMSLFLGLTLVAGAAPAVFAQEETEVEAQVAVQGEVHQIEGLESTVFAYFATELYNPIVSMMPVFFYYPDEPILEAEAAQEKLQAAGLLDLAEREKAAVMVINPLSEDGYTEADVENWRTVTKVLTKDRSLELNYTVPYDRMDLKKLFMVGEGKGADFIATYLNSDIASTVTAGALLVGAQAVAAEPAYAVPAYLVGCSEDVAALYKGINETDTEEELEGKTLAYNSSYVMESGYTPKRVFCCEGEALTPEVLEDAWNSLLKLLWTQNLEYTYFTEGVECGLVSDRPNYDELAITMNIVEGEQAAEESGGTQERWIEWIPDVVQETMDKGGEETYPLIVLMHGNGDHEIYEAESNGWVWLAEQEGIILVAPKEIWESGRPPESAPNRYGKENAQFIRDVICQKFPVDMSRVYIAGFSIGGFETADTSAADPGLFAAAAPMAYPGDGYMQIFPYEMYGSDAAALDIPMMYMCGKQDGGNTMPNPADPNGAKVLSMHLFFNQLLTFNEMTDQLLDLVDFDYDWYPGEKDIKVDRMTGEESGEGYDFWDGTAATYITQNLDFEAYPFYGYDITAVENTSQDTITTPEGVVADRNIYYNEEGWPMLEYLIMGDMQHQHYTRYARIIWEDLFSHYTRDPETGVLSYDGTAATK